MTAKQNGVIQAFDEIEPGDRVEIERVTMLGRILRRTKTQGTVVRVERRRHGWRFYRKFANKAYSTVILLRQAAGELKNIVVDKFTTIRHSR